MSDIPEGRLLISEWVGQELHRVDRNELMSLNSRLVIHNIILGIKALPCFDDYVVNVGFPFY